MKKPEKVRVWFAFDAETGEYIYKISGRTYSRCQRELDLYGKLPNVRPVEVEISFNRESDISVKPRRKRGAK